MKVLCMFDLPVETEEQRRAYRVFRKNLMKEGFTMIQYSVYVRTCQNREHGKRIEKRLRQILPKEGNIRILAGDRKAYAGYEVIGHGR